MSEKNYDESLLLVKGTVDSGDYVDGERPNTQYVKKLANAILKVISKHNVAKLRCVGAPSVNNGVKAFTIASERFLSQEDNDGSRVLCVKSSFTSVDFGGEPKTGIIMSVYKSCVCANGAEEDGTSQCCNDNDND